MEIIKPAREWTPQTLDEYLREKGMSLLAVTRLARIPYRSFMNYKVTGEFPIQVQWQLDGIAAALESETVI